MRLLYFILGLVCVLGVVVDFYLGRYWVIPLPTSGAFLWFRAFNKGSFL